MRIVIIDAQGGGLGRQLVSALKEALPDVTLHAVGTNSAAAAAMHKAGATVAATGENAVRVACRRADIIVGPVGIVVADAMQGEITAAMAAAVGESAATRVLIPFNNCDTIIAGVRPQAMSALIEAAVAEVCRLCKAATPARD